MTAEQVVQIQALFGAMLRNAQALERLVIQSQVGLNETDVELWTNTLQHLAALTSAQTNRLALMQEYTDTNRRMGERRTGSDRRWGP